MYIKKNYSRYFVGHRYARHVRLLPLRQFRWRDIEHFLKLYGLACDYFLIAVIHVMNGADRATGFYYF